MAADRSDDAREVRSASTGVPGAATRVVDAIGLPCPQPVIALARAVEEVTVGAHVHLLADDPAVRVDVPVWCRLKRQRLAAQSVDDDGVWTFEVVRLR